MQSLIYHFVANFLLVRHRAHFARKAGAEEKGSNSEYI